MSVDEVVFAQRHTSINPCIKMDERKLNKRKAKGNTMKSIKSIIGLLLALSTMGLFAISASAATVTHNYNNGYTYDDSGNRFYSYADIETTGTTFGDAWSGANVQTYSQSISTSAVYLTTYIGVSYYDNEGYAYSMGGQKYLGYTDGYTTYSIISDKYSCNTEWVFKYFYSWSGVSTSSDHGYHAPAAIDSAYFWSTRKYLVDIFNLT